jgi:hypothetical protein
LVAGRPNIENKSKRGAERMVENEQVERLAGRPKIDANDKSIEHGGKTGWWVAGASKNRIITSEAALHAARSESLTLFQPFFSTFNIYFLDGN